MENPPDLVSLPPEIKSIIKKHYLTAEEVPPEYQEPRDFLPHIQQTKETLRQEVEKRDRFYDPNYTEPVAFDEDFIDDLRSELVEINRMINAMQRLRVIRP